MHDNDTPMPQVPPIAYLERLTEGHTEVIRLDPAVPCRFGRQERNNVVLLDKLVSRNHAFIESRNGREYFVVDLGSRNGTLINGSPIRRSTRLRDGDQIGIGPYTFVFREETECTLPDSGTRSQATVAHIPVEVITVLVADIRGFTNWAQTEGASGVSKFMAELFNEADAILRRHRVWGHKYIGDAVMAIWRHPPNCDATVVRSALLSTVELFQALATLNTKAKFKVPLKFGAGLNTGQASVGNLGSNSNADYTALGDSVNKAFRLEAATRTANCDILLGEATYRWLEPGSSESVFGVQTVSLKGYADPEQAWAVSSEDLADLLGRTAPKT